MPRPQLEVLTSLPAAMHLPACPACHAEALLGRADGGMECAACGMVFEVDGGAGAAGQEGIAHLPPGAAPGAGNKKRNYTPERGIKSLLPAVGLPALAPRSQGTVLPPPHHQPGPAPAPAAATGPADSPVRAPALPHAVQPVHVPPLSTRENEVFSHVMEEQRRRARRRNMLLLAGVLVVAGAGGLVFELRKGDNPPDYGAPQEGAMNLPAPESSSGRNSEIDLVGARRFLAGKVAKAEKWEDLLPFIRKRGEVEPLMREYYASHPFESWAGRQVRQEKTSRNGSGLFVAFLLDGKPGVQPSVTMVECAKDGFLLDWEMSVNYAWHQWDAFRAARPTTPTTVRALVARTFVRDDLLLPDERPAKDNLVAAMIYMLSRDNPLYVIAAADSEIGKWIVATPPWDHEDRSIMERLDLAFDPAHAGTADRVTIVRVVGENWTR